MNTILRRIVCSQRAPAPVGPYSQAVVINDTMYVSGQIGMDPQSGVLAQGGVEAEAEQCFKNMRAILEDGGSKMSNVVKTTVLLADISDWPKVNEVYQKYFIQPYPARAAYQVGALPKGAKVEVEAVAVVGKIEDEKAKM